MLPNKQSIRQGGLAQTLGNLNSLWAQQHLQMHGVSGGLWFRVSLLLGFRVGRCKSLSNIVNRHLQPNFFMADEHSNYV